MVVVVEDCPFRCIGPGQAVLAVGVFQPLPGRQLNGRQAAIPIVLVLGRFAQRGRFGGNPVDSVVGAVVVSRRWHHQGGSVAVLVVLAERGMAVRVSDFGDSPEQIVLIKRLLAVGGRYRCDLAPAFAAESVDC